MANEATYPTISPFTGKRGPKTYKAAGAKKQKSSYVRGAKKAQGDNLAKKVKKISNKVMKGRKLHPGPAAHSTYGGNMA